MQAHLFATITLLTIAAFCMPTALASSSNFHKYSSIKKLSDAIDNGNFDNDHINYKSFKSWSGFKDASSKVQHCITKAYNNGHNLGDYEVYDCVD